MISKHALTLLTVLASNAFLQTASAQSEGKTKTVATPLPAQQKTPLKGQVDYLATLLHGSGIMIESWQLPSPITTVRPGSPAYYAGLAVNDKILSCKIDGGRLQIMVSRKGKVYGTTLQTQAPSPDKSTGRPIVRPSGQIGNGLSEAEIAVLKENEFVIMVDSSGSMTWLLEGSKSRWEWCRDNISSFAKMAETLAKKKITLVTFSKTHNIRKDCTADDVMLVFNKSTPNGDTNLGTPLQAVLDEYIAKGANYPLTVAVITDGEPTEGADTARVIINFTKAAKTPSLVRIIFYCISKESKGEFFVRHLDMDLYGCGAKADIVDGYYLRDLYGGFEKTLLKSK